MCVRTGTSSPIDADASGEIHVRELNAAILPASLGFEVKNEELKKTVSDIEGNGAIDGNGERRTSLRQM